MDFNKFQQESRKTAIYPNVGSNITYPTLGLAGETGEVAEKIKKIVRDQDGIITDDNRKDIELELGDVLYYVASIASELKLSLNNVAIANINKLQSRKKRDALKGSGDKR